MTPHDAGHTYREQAIMSNADAAQVPDSESVTAQPIEGTDTSVTPNDPAQAEWDRTTAIDEGLNPDDVSTATGGDPAEIPADDDDIPADDLVTDLEQPDTQGTLPLEAELGDDGQGDLSPEDL